MASSKRHSLMWAVDSEDERDSIDDAGAYIDDDSDPDWAEECARKGNKIKFDHDSSSNSSLSLEKDFGQKTKKIKTSPKPQKSRIHKDKEGKGNSGRNKELLVLIDEDEKADTDEIDMLLKMQNSLQKMSKNQDILMELMSKFVKSRQSCST